MKELTHIEQLKIMRTELESQTKKVVTEIVMHELKEALEEPLKEAGIEVTSISWDFYPESDDEGGANYYPEGVEIFTVGGIDLEGIIIKEKSKYSDTVYETDVEEWIREQLSNYSSDLYDYDIYEIVF